MLPTISGTGRLTQDPELRFSPSGMAVATINLAFNSRKLNRDTGEWEDDSVFFVRATAFKQLAENAAETLSRGVEVAVSGRLKTEQWNDKESGEKRSAVSLMLDSIGPNLAFATAKVNRVDRSHGGGSSSVSEPSSDPWGSSQNSPSTSTEEPPF